MLEEYSWKDYALGIRSREIYHARIDAKKEAMEEARKEVQKEVSERLEETAKETYVRTLEECGISFVEALKRYANKFNVSISDAKTAVSTYWY